MAPVSIEAQVKLQYVFPGIPNGWFPVRYGKLVPGDYYLAADGKIILYNGPRDDVTSQTTYTQRLIVAPLLPSMVDLLELFPLGHRVQVLESSIVDYNGNDKILMSVVKYDPPRIGIVTRKLKKALGTYVPQRGPSSDEDYEPATMKVDKYITLYRVAFSLTESVLVHEPHLRCLE